MLDWCVIATKFVKTKIKLGPDSFWKHLVVGCSRNRTLGSDVRFKMSQTSEQGHDIWCVQTLPLVRTTTKEREKKVMQYVSHAPN